MVQLPAAGNGAIRGLTPQALPIICSNSASLMEKAAFPGLSCWRRATDRD
jgi:hypothetical protein